MLTVIYKFYKDRELRSGMLAQTEGKTIKMEIVGYVPYSAEWFFDIQKFVVCADRLKLEVDSKKNGLKVDKDYVVPIAKWVKIPDEEKEYEATPCLNILSLNEGSKVRYNNFLKFWGSVNSDSTRAKLLELEEFSKHEDDCIYYYVSKRENVFYNSMNKAIAIADVFLCLCSYINSISGKVEYVMVSPEFIIPVFK